MGKGRITEYFGFVDQSWVDRQFRILVWGGIPLYQDLTYHSTRSQAIQPSTRLCFPGWCWGCWPCCCQCLSLLFLNLAHLIELDVNLLWQHWRRLYSVVASWCLRLRLLLSNATAGHTSASWSRWQGVHHSAAWPIESHIQRCQLHWLFFW